MECLLADKVIMQQGEEPRAAYVMIQGSCSVHVELTFKALDRVKTKTVSPAAPLIFLEADERHYKQSIIRRDLLAIWRAADCNGQDAGVLSRNPYR